MLYVQAETVCSRRSSRLERLPKSRAPPAACSSSLLSLPSQGGTATKPGRCLPVTQSKRIQLRRESRELQGKKAKARVLPVLLDSNEAVLMATL